MEANRKQLMAIYFMARQLQYYSESRDIISPSNVSSIRNELDNDEKTEYLPAEIKDELESNLRNIWSLINSIK